LKFAHHHIKTTAKLYYTTSFDEIKIKLLTLSNNIDVVFLMGFLPRKQKNHLYGMAFLEPDHSYCVLLFRYYYLNCSVVIMVYF